MDMSATALQPHPLRGHVVGWRQLWLWRQLGPEGNTNSAVSYLGHCGERTSLNHSLLTCKMGSQIPPPQDCCQNKLSKKQTKNNPKHPTQSRYFAHDSERVISRFQTHRIFPMLCHAGRYESAGVCTRMCLS